MRILVTLNLFHHAEIRNSITAPTSTGHLLEVLFSSFSCLSRHHHPPICLQRPGDHRNKWVRVIDGVAASYEWTSVASVTSPVKPN